MAEEKDSHQPGSIHVEKPKANTVSRRRFLNMAGLGTLATLASVIGKGETRKQDEQDSVKNNPKPAGLLDSRVDEPDSRVNRIELKDNWEQLFAPVTPEEAKELSEQSEEFLFPFDPRGSEQLVLESSTIEANGNRKVVTVKNLTQDTVIYSPFKGTYSKTGASGDYPRLLMTVEGQDMSRPVAHKGTPAAPGRQVFNLISAESNVFEGEFQSQEEVNIGSRIAIFHKSFTPQQRPEGEPDISFAFERPNFYDYGQKKPFNFLKKDGKIAFIETPRVISGRF